jgi:hypothetical protein
MLVERDTRMKHVFLLWMMGLYDLIFHGILYKPV